MNLTQPYKRNRHWDRTHRPYRYVNVPLEVRGQVLEVAEQLLVSADEVARRLLEHGLRQRFQSLDPPQVQKDTLVRHPTVSYCLPHSLHVALRTRAMERAIPLGTLVTSLLLRGLNSYRAGELHLHAHSITVRMTLHSLYMSPHTSLSEAE